MITTALRPLIGALFAAPLLAACALVAPAPTAAPGDTPAPPPATPLPAGLTDERAVTAGICFESAFDAAGRVFVLRSPEELAWLFDSSDASGFCRRPAARGTFDFGGANGQPGRALAGLWSKGIGCTADHAVENVTVDDAARTLTVRLRLVVEGDCPYELVRPFWIGITGYNEYDIRLLVE
ncbi:MAG: hypothetical protein JNL34_14155 [Anaerolineae bacterium]|nr:hypothetical protein [Anaerolineae bacterium]